MVRPPIVECFIRSYIEALFWRWSFCKCIGYVGTIDWHIFTGCYCIEEAGACLVNTIGVRFVQNLDVSRPCRAITDTSGFLSIIGFLNVICPDKVKDCVISVGLGRLTEHALGFILVEL